MTTRFLVVVLTTREIKQKGRTFTKLLGLPGYRAVIGDGHILEIFLARLQSIFLRWEPLVAYACGPCVTAVDWSSLRMSFRG